VVVKTTPFKEVIIYKK